MTRLTVTKKTATPGQLLMTLNGATWSKGISLEQPPKQFCLKFF
jgi:hypothetical protein